MANINSFELRKFNMKIKAKYLTFIDGKLSEDFYDLLKNHVNEIKNEQDREIKKYLLYIDLLLFIFGLSYDNDTWLIYVNFDYGQPRNLKIRGIDIKNINIQIGELFFGMAPFLKPKEDNQLLMEKMIESNEILFNFLTNRNLLDKIIKTRLDIVDKTLLNEIYKLVEHNSIDLETFYKVQNSFIKLQLNTILARMKIGMIPDLILEPLFKAITDKNNKLSEIMRHEIESQKGGYFYKKYLKYKTKYLLSKMST